MIQCLFSTNIFREKFIINNRRLENSNKCSMKTSSKDCVGYGSDGYCQWCGANGCHSSDEISKKNIQGCKG